MKNTVKNDNLAELRPAFTKEPPAYIAHDEISLVDITLVLLRRKALIAIVLGLSIIVGILATTLTSNRLSYTTTIKIGTHIIDNKVVPLETPETLLVKINHSFIPQVLNEFPTPVSINASVPKKSEVILLTATAAQDSDDKTPIVLLNRLAKIIEQDQNKIFASIKDNLTNHLKPVSLEAFATQTASLQKTYRVSAPIKSSAASSPSNKVILAISLFAGVFLGVFAAFCAEFWTKVKQAQKKMVDC